MEYKLNDNRGDATLTIGQSNFKKYTMTIDDDGYRYASIELHEMDIDNLIAALKQLKKNLKTKK